MPLTYNYQGAFRRRVRQTVEITGADPFDVWCARLEDVIIGLQKLIA